MEFREESETYANFEKKINKKQKRDFQFIVCIHKIYEPKYD